MEIGLSSNSTHQTPEARRGFGWTATRRLHEAVIGKWWRRGNALSRQRCRGICFSRQPNSTSRALWHRRRTRGI